MNMSDKRVYLYDSTLRDGQQTQGVDFSAADKTAIAKALDELSIDYIEGGWPGANPTDDAFFANPPKLKNSKLTAFGMTRRAGRSASNDPGLTTLAQSAAIVCMVGKSWDFQVTEALGIELSENIAMISESIAHLKSQVSEVMFDAEHFFDGYKANRDYALAAIKAAYEAGARWVVLCDTNGGTLPDEIFDIVTDVCSHVPGENVGIHCHNDTENAVANSLAAVRAGARQVQGTLNGLGERCGNANLVSIIPTLMLKMGYDVGISHEQLAHLRRISHILDERLNREPTRQAAYVGDSAFAHKGGLHVSAVEKNPACYEHIEPELVGNQRHILVSDQAGRSNILARFREIGVEVDPKSDAVGKLVEAVKQREFDGYAYDGAEASFELLARKALGELDRYFRVTSFRVIDERRWVDEQDEQVITMSEATVKVVVGDGQFMSVAEGNGPVNALDAALRKVLLTVPEYVEPVQQIELIDYKVRIITRGDGTRAVTRVMIESRDAEGNSWSTVGVSTNIIEASYNALRDSITYKLFKSGVRSQHA
ncbi:alpha-isopropylmalate/homocitrate synthase family transferase [Thalassospira xiamenensis M-5 = DSM 17429]|uniref:Citramalate synthase n=2 Tax=Thalassospira xiamenensis TaxID=220697 RepID=A0AB72U9P6_9PROT|nr:alpha-isopropylmalate/homocitrate synthase family transferase [Thalassospira xiamenensis M-5 = DSM 17429]